MKTKTSDLTLLALDWAVAECEGMDIEIRPAGACGRPLYVLAAEAGRTPWTWTPTTSWHQAGPIIEREGIAVDVVRAGWTIDSWVAALVHEDKEFDGVARAEEYGPTPLIAAMRCYVASKLGDEVDIPEELL